MRLVKSVLLALLIANLFSSLSYAATSDRIVGTIDSTNMVEVRGHVAPIARPEFDQGPVEPSRTMRVTALFMPTPQQQQALTKLLAEQQDRNSPNFHKWLTSDQYGERFGLSRGDLAKIRAWLEAAGLKITYVAHGRDFIGFEGNAAQIGSVFKTEIHYYNFNGKKHFANATAPSIPAALSGIVGGFRGLHDFLPHSMLRQHPDYTVSGPTPHSLAPGDLATIYDITPAIDGTGQNVVIAGQSDVYLADLHDYRTAFGIPDISGCTMDSTNTVIQAGACTSGNFQMVVPGDGSDPGLVAGDLSESDLDIELMSAVAPKAQIIFVTSSNGVDDSTSWAIDQNPPLAPVISYSYGLCEALATAPGPALSDSVPAKGASEGISFFAASGDFGSATCDGDLVNNPTSAVYGLSVSYPASSQYVTGVGGTEFNEGTGTYWNTTNNPTNGGSATMHIPEIGWNDTTFSIAAGFGFDATGGGPSNCANGTGTTTVVGGFAMELCTNPPGGGFAKPSWQDGITPDSVRDVPDIAFSASNVNDPYIVCIPQSETPIGTLSTSTCHISISDAIITWNSLVGGTSTSTPVAAGMTVLLNQYLGTNGLGSINQQLYTLYTTSPGSFHDIQTGTNSSDEGTSDNIVPCTSGTPSFEVPALRCTGTSMGYKVAGAHVYSTVTGLGSLDITKFIQAWGTSRTASTLALASSASKTYQSGSVTLTATVTPPTPTGDYAGNVTFSSGSTALGTVALGTTGTAQLATTQLPLGTDTVTAAFQGNGALKGSSNTTTVTVVTAFTLSPQNPTYQVPAGQTANVTINVNTNGSGFSGNLTYTCSQPAALTESMCNVPSPEPYPSSSPASFQVTTTAPSASLRRPFDRTRIFYAALLPGLLGIVFTFGSRRHALGGMRMLGLIMVLGLSTLWLGSCGGNNSSSSNPGTPKGSYTITINATTSGANPASGTTTFVLQVQ